MADEPDRARTPAEHNRIETRQWVEQVALDPDLPPRATQIAIFLAALIDRRPHSPWQFWAFPSQPLLARLAGGITVKALQNAINRLVKSGHLESRKRSQTSNAYRPKLQKPHRSIIDTVRHFADEIEKSDTNKTSHLTSNVKAKKTSHRNGARRTNLPPNANKSSAQHEEKFQPTRTFLRPKPTQETSEETSFEKLAADGGALQAPPPSSSSVCGGRVSESYIDNPPSTARLMGAVDDDRDEPGDFRADFDDSLRDLRSFENGTVRADAKADTPPAIAAGEIIYAADDSPNDPEGADDDDIPF